MKRFSSYDEYDRWTEMFEDPSDYQDIAVAIDDGWKVSVDMFTECKSYKTALRRFEKTFRDVHADITGWVESMREACENGYFKATATEQLDLEEIRKFAEGGTYSWGVEETAEGYWYIFLNISGIYASREAV